MKATQLPGTAIPGAEPPGMLRGEALSNEFSRKPSVKQDEATGQPLRSNRWQLACGRELQAGLTSLRNTNVRTHTDHKEHACWCSCFLQHFWRRSLLTLSTER